MDKGVVDDSRRDDLGAQNWGSPWLAMKSMTASMWPFPKHRFGVFGCAFSKFGHDLTFPCSGTGVPTSASVVNVTFTNVGLPHLRESGWLIVFSMLGRGRRRHCLFLSARGTREGPTSPSAGAR